MSESAFDAISRAAAVLKTSKVAEVAGMIPVVSVLYVPESQVSNVIQGGHVDAIVPSSMVGGDFDSLQRIADLEARAVEVDVLREYKNF